MKSWIRSIKATLRSNSGETIMEGVASLLILSILLMSVAAMIVTSMRMSGIFTEDARRMQEEVANAMINGTYFEDESLVEERQISFSFTLFDEEKATHWVKYGTNEGMVAYIPIGTVSGE